MVAAVLSITEVMAECSKVGRSTLALHDMALNQDWEHCYCLIALCMAPRFPQPAESSMHAEHDMVWLQLC